jgi:branched-chain amino acid transport system ATP-binding protein
MAGTTAMREAILTTANLTRRFDGLTAVDGVTLELCASSVHAVIGPNGAGKSTLVNLLSGELEASGGTVHLRGDDITNWSADRIACLGVARTFQHTNLFADFTAFENCRLAAQSRDASLARCLMPAESYVKWNEAANRALAVVGLAGRGSLSAGALSHGERRALEIAMSLATSPSVLLLDEPLAGMGGEESARIVDLLRQLSADHAILLIEHDMDAVFALADVLTVMVNGSVLATGEPADIRANPEVQRAYLGADATRKIA